MAQKPLSFQLVDPLLHVLRDISKGAVTVQADSTATVHVSTLKHLHVFETLLLGASVSSSVAGGGALSCRWRFVQSEDGARPGWTSFCDNVRQSDLSCHEGVFSRWCVCGPKETVALSHLCPNKLFRNVLPQESALKRNIVFDFRCVCACVIPRTDYIGYVT